MFDYEKTLKKLKKFGELSEKKQNKVFARIFLEDDYRTWFYKLDERGNIQPMTGPMVKQLTTILVTPPVLKKLAKFVENCDGFDHSAASLTYMVAEQALVSANEDSEAITSKYKDGSLDSKKIKEYKEKSDKYHEIVARLINAIQDRRKADLKDISKKTGLPRNMIFTTTLSAPGHKYIPKYKIGIYTNQLLRDIYAWFSNNEYDENVSDIKWGPYFGYIFGNDMTTSAATSILLEGVRRIDDYRDSAHFDNVRAVWDTLTTFGLNELNNAPENTRRQMLEIYLKRVENITQNGRKPVRLRVDLLTLPNEFNNLIRTVSGKSNRLATLMGKNINNFGTGNNTNNNNNNERRNDRRNDQKRFNNQNISEENEAVNEDIDSPYKPAAAYEGENIEAELNALRNSTDSLSDDDDDNVED